MSSSIAQLARRTKGGVSRRGLSSSGPSIGSSLPTTGRGKDGGDICTGSFQGASVSRGGAVYRSDVVASSPHSLAESPMRTAKRANLWRMVRSIAPDGLRHATTVKPTMAVTIRPQRMLSNHGNEQEQAAARAMKHAEGKEIKRWSSGVTPFGGPTSMACECTL